MENKRRIKFLRTLTVFLIIFSWIFSGWPRIFNFPPKIQRVHAAIEYVGGASGTGTGSTYSVSLTSLTGGIGSAAQAGDLVVVVTGWASSANGDPGVTTTGYNEVYDLYGNDTRDANVSVNWKIMDTIPDSSVTVRGFGNSANGGATVVHVWRGVNQASPMDVPPPTGFTSSNNAWPNSPSITPVTNGAIVLTVGGGTGDNTPLGFSAPGGYSNAISTPGTGSTMSFIAVIASKVWSGSGGEDPAGWSGGESTNSDSIGAGTLALRPAITTLSNGTNPGDSTIGPGGVITSVNEFILTTSAGTDAITAITVNLSTNGGVGTLTVTDGADVVLGSIGGGVGSGIVTGSNQISITSTNATTGGTVFKVKVTPLSHANMPPPAGGEYFITGVVTDWIGNNIKAGQTDDTSSIVTIDNLSPNGATAVSGTAGNAKVILNWTTSNSDDFITASSSVIYRWIGSTVGTEAPAEGSAAIIGTPNGSATVACVVSAASSTPLSKIDGAGGSAECTTSTLTNGQPYTYKVFQKDINGNYDVGVLIGTFTPIASATWLALEDQNVSGINKQINIRLRIELANTGGSANNYQYRLEYASKIGISCGDDESFSVVPVNLTGANEHFEMTTSTFVSNGDSTTAKLTNIEGYTFVSGYIVADPVNTSPALNLGINQYTELEYVIQASTYAIEGGSYCFQVTNAGAILNDYNVYPEVAIAGGAGVLTITSPTSTDFLSKNVSTNSQNSSTTISYIEVSDSRSGSPGWSVTMISKQYTARSGVYRLAGGNNTVTFSGIYTGSYGVLNPVGTYIVEITTGGGVGTAIFKWINPLSTVTEDVTTASSVSLNAGVSANFGAATYQAGDRWQIAVDVFSYTGLYITPSDITLISGSLDGVDKGSAGYLTGSGDTSDSKTIMSANVGYGTGVYRQDEGLDLIIHSNSLSEDYSAVVTFTAL